MMQSRKPVEDGITSMALYVHYPPDEIPELLKPVILTHGKKVSNKIKAFIEGIGNEPVSGKVVYDFYRRNLGWQPLYTFSHNTGVSVTAISNFLEDNPLYAVKVFTGTQRNLICNPAMKSNFASTKKLKFSRNITSDITRKLEHICDNGFAALESMKSVGLNYYTLRPLFKKFKMNFRGDFLPRPLVSLHNRRGKHTEIFNREYYNVLVRGIYGDLVVDDYAKPTQKFDFSELFEEAKSYINPKDTSILPRDTEKEVCNKFLTVAREIRKIEKEFGLSVVSMRKIAALLDSSGYVYFSTGRKKFSKAIMTHALSRISELERLSNHFATILLNHNERLIMNFAKKYSSYAKSVTFKDLVQDGRIVLTHALKKFDPNNGTKFSTYASWWIQQAMSRALIEKDRVINVPVYLNELNTKVDRFSKKFLANKERLPTEKEISENLSISMQNVERALTTANLYSVKSFSDEVNRHDGKDSELPLESLIASSSKDNAEDEFVLEVHRKLIVGDVAKLLSSLPPRWEKVLRMRFGISGYDEHTLEEIGQEFNITRERVRQIEAEALNRLRGLDGVYKFAAESI